ncbi:MAG: phytoene desaturase [Nitrospirae bacterium]|nr:phytoene desaturase [Nitrospirota bacterium]
MKKKIAIIGAGPGGLAAAMLLLNKGYEVAIFEKETAVGGRTGRFLLGDYIFDIGPTFLMLPQYMEEIFRLAGRNIHDYVEITPLDPLYRLRFADGTEFYPSTDIQKILSEIQRVFPGQVENYMRFRHDEHYRFNRIERCFKRPYDSVYDFLRPTFLEALPQMDITGSLRDRLEKYFTNEKMRLAMTFQTKYIGMSPWRAPSAYSLISFIEYQWGIHHVTGGLNQLTLAMARVIEERGGRIYTSTAVKSILTTGNKATGIVLESGRKIGSDYVIINANFAYAMSSFLKDRKKYTDAELEKREYSCSTFMLYLGVKRQYDIPHHNLIFGEDFKKYMDEITMKRRPSPESLVYIHNPAITDTTLAPKGKSPIYILVPVPNNKASIDWDKLKPEFRRQVLDFIAANTELKDIGRYIEEEKIITPQDWERDFNVYKGAVFNLNHDLNQMFYFRPHNRSEELSNCYITGGGTHPGSGLPNICISSVITSELLIRDDTGDRQWRFDNKMYL